MPETIAIRLSGGADRVQALLETLGALPAVDHVVEMDLDVPAPEDHSNSAGLPDAEASPHQDVELNLASALAYDDVRGRLEVLAARAGIVVEWLDEE